MTTLHVLTRPILILISTFSAGVISNYDRYNPSDFLSSSRLGASSYKSWHNAISSALLSCASTPTPTTFALSWATFTFASSILYYSHRTDKYQDRILAIAVLHGIVISTIISERDILATLGRYMPVFITASMMTSAIVHWVLALFCGGAQPADAMEDDIVGKKLQEFDGE